MIRLLLTLVGLVILCILFANLDPFFAGNRNVLNVMRQIAPILLIGIGQSVVLVTGNIDLSIGSIIGMSAMLSATLMSYGMSPVFAVLITIPACMIFGFLNGELVARVKMPSYIATMGTMMICRGIAQIANGNYDTGFIGNQTEGFRNLFYYGKLLGVYSPVWIAAIVWALAFFLLSKTRTGRHFYAIGSNPVAAGLSDVNVIATTDKAYVISAFCAAIAGLISTAELGYGNMAGGTVYELYAVAAAVVGGISTLGGRGLLAGTVVGASIWGVLQNGLIRVLAPVAIRNIAIGIIIIVIVSLDIRMRYRKSDTL